MRRSHFLVVTLLALLFVAGMICGADNIRQILSETAANRPDALLFGTDWPICDVGAHIELVKSLDVSEETRERIFSGNAQDLFKLKV